MNFFPSEVEEWKKNKNIMKSYKKLFRRMVADDSSSTFMSKIIDKVWPAKKNTPKVHIAYAISVCQFILDLLNQKVQVSEALLKFKIVKYLVSFSLNHEIINRI